MKTILVGSADSTVSVVESLQEVEKMANAARAIAAPMATEFFREWMRCLMVFMLIAIRVVFAMGKLFVANAEASIDFYRIWCLKRKSMATTSVASRRSLRM